MLWIRLIRALLLIGGAGASIALLQAEIIDRSSVSDRLLGAGLSPAIASDIQSDILQKAFPKAEEKLIAQIERATHPRSLLELLGGVFFLDANYLQAAVAYKKAERYGVLSENARFTLVMSYIELKRTKWARDELLRLSKEKPRQAEYHYWLGRLDYDDQRFADGIARFDRAIESDGGLVRAYDGRGLCEEAIGTVDFAEQDYKRANVLNREQASRYAAPPLDYGTMLEKAGRYSEAKALLKEALAIDPSMAKAYYELGRVEEQSSNFEAATESFETAAKLDPNDPSAPYALFRLYTRMKKKELAAAMMVRFRLLKAQSSSR